MSQNSYLWQVYCLTESANVNTISDTEPTTCPNNIAHTIDDQKTVVLQVNYIELSTNSYINVQSNLADNEAIKINASNTNGGINIDAGLGGITVDTTNSISLDANAASNFTTSAGNLILESTTGLLNLNGGSGINMGGSSTTGIINIGASADAKTVTVGNLTSTTAVNILTGTGGLDVQSAGRFDMNTSSTATDSFKLSSGGGVDIDCSGGMAIDTANGGSISMDVVGASSNFSIATNGSSQDMVISVVGATDSSLFLYSEGTALDALSLTSANGGVIISSSGSQAMVLTSNGGLIGIGTWTGGEIQIGTAAVARTITVGNTTDNTVININAGGIGGGINIGTNNNTGSITIGDATTAKTLTLGNNTTNSKLFERFGSGGLILTQLAPGAVSATPTIADLLLKILNGTPTGTETLTLPTAGDAVSGIPGIRIDDSIEFSIINQSTTPTDIYTLASGTGGTLIGNMTVDSNTSGTFRMRFTSISGGSEAYVIYRVA